jgi:hypothetical protein
MDTEKMTKEERRTAELAIQNLHEAVERLSNGYEQARDLCLKYGWDMDYVLISQAAMIAGKEALDIVDSIAWIDGWEHHKSKESEVRDED